MNDTEKIQKLFTSPLTAINIGPALFGKALEKQNVEVAQVDWKPLAGGNKQMQEILAALGGI